MAHLDRPMYLLGYLASTSRVYLIDKEFGIVSYTLLMSLIEYKTLVMRGDEEAAASILPTIPKVLVGSHRRLFACMQSTPAKLLPPVSHPGGRDSTARGGCG